MYSQRQARDFERIFKANLKDYWLPGPLGFDIIKFDDDVVKSGNMSVRDAVQQTYGMDAVALCHELLGIRKEGGAQ